MFSNNNRISTRQVFRLFVFDFVGESTLILPSQLAAFAGNDGLASIVLGGIREDKESELPSGDRKSTRLNSSHPK